MSKKEAARKAQDVEKEAKEKLKAGWIHAIVTFEIIGKPKAHVDESAKQLLDVLGKDERVFFIEKNFGKAKETDDGFFAAFAEVDLLVKNAESLTWLGINFTPSSVEIIEPLDFKFSALDLQTWYNDLLAHLHQIGYTYKMQNSEMQFLKHNLSQLINNSILLSLGRSAKNVDDISRDTSLTKDTVEPHLKKLVENKKVLDKAGLYMLA